MVLFLANRAEWELFLKMISLFSVFRVGLRVPIYQVWRKMELFCETDDAFKECDREIGH